TAAKRWRDRCTLKYLAVKNFLARKEEGATLVEYALLVALIALACIVAIGGLGNGRVREVKKIKNKPPQGQRRPAPRARAALPPPGPDCFSSGRSVREPKERDAHEIAAERCRPRRPCRQELPGA